MAKQARLFPAYEPDGSPVYCPVCDSTNIMQVVLGYEAGFVSECECRCGDCGISIAYWAYGSYDPNSFIDFTPQKGFPTPCPK